MMGSKVWSNGIKRYWNRVQWKEKGDNCHEGTSDFVPKPKVKVYG